jgi:transmembrane sensor
MTHSTEDSIRQEAARWFQNRIGGGLAPGEEARFDAWLKADPLHAREYRALEKLWSKLDALPLVPRDADRRKGNRAVVHAAVFAVLTLAVATTAVIGYRWHVAQPIHAASYSTKAGERARATLPDGTQVELGAASRLRLTFYRDRRESVLESGEAYFSVARASSQPFTVAAGPASVRVTGTRFSVRHMDGAAQVALDEGSIEVSAPGSGTTQLAAPAAVRADANGVVRLAAADVERLTGWRRGQLLFHDQALAEVAQELSRYRAQPVTVADATTASLKVTGIAFLERPDAFLEGLAGVLPVALDRAADGAIVIRALPGK